MNEPTKVSFYVTQASFVKQCLTPSFIILRIYTLTHAVIATIINLRLIINYCLVNRIKHRFNKFFPLIKILADGLFTNLMRLKVKKEKKIQSVIRELVSLNPYRFFKYGTFNFLCYLYISFKTDNSKMYTLNWKKNTIEME